MKASGRAKRKDGECRCKADAPCQDSPRTGRPGAGKPSVRKEENGRDMAGTRGDQPLTALLNRYQGV